jgi:hypothetical protein
MRRFRITIQQTKTELHEMELDGQSAMEVLDLARAQVKERNQHTTGTVFAVKKVEELES